jgi:probable O-glycosylation ligase (exosortase A-associated)
VALRDIFLFVVILGAIPFILRHPYIGVFYWVWLGLMNPHRLSWGAAYDFQFALVIAAVTFAGLLFTKDERRWKAGPEVYVLMLLLVWVSLTTLQAMEPQAAYDEWKRVLKIQVMTFVALIVLHSKRHIEVLVWILALSVGFFGIKGGIFTILTGGNFRVWGPPGSYIEDNNALALATVMTIPLFYYLFTQATNRWLRLALIGAMVLCAFSSLGSHSRGALLAIGAMSGLLWLHSRNKFMLGAALAIVAPMLIAFMPAEWGERMGTIRDHQGEGSAESRLATWSMLTRIANDRFFGAGFEPYTQKVWSTYMPEWPTVHAAHSIWFEILGEHGWTGLVLFVAMWLLVWRSSGWIIRASRNREDLKWAASLSAMIRVSLVGYFVGGTFLNLAYWDLPYYELVIIVLLRDLVRRESVAAGARFKPEARGTHAGGLRAGAEPPPGPARAVVPPPSQRAAHPAKRPLAGEGRSDFAARGTHPDTGGTDVSRPD